MLCVHLVCGFFCFYTFIYCSFIISSNCFAFQSKPLYHHNSNIFLLNYHQKDVESFKNLYESDDQFSPRLFNPAFCYEILNPLSIVEVENILQVKQMIRIQENNEDENYKLIESKTKDKLPWSCLPLVGLAIDNKRHVSSKEIDAIYETVKPYGSLVWVMEAKKLEPGILLVNNFKQEIIFLKQYNPESGGIGEYFTLSSDPAMLLEKHWPPLSLELEVLDGIWQPIKASDSIVSKQALQCLPTEMKKAVWEFILLLMLSPDKHQNELQALLDTGLSPHRGFIAYIRLLLKVKNRSKELDDIPKEYHIFDDELYVDVSNESIPDLNIDNEFDKEELPTSSSS